MTPKQRLFAENYVLDHNGAAAAVRAGYARAGAHVTASRLLRKANVASLVAEHEAQAAERLAITREKVLAELQEAIELARQQGDVPAMISGWKLVCQMCGYLAPERKKVELSVDAEALQAKFAAMDDSELLAIADGRSELLS